MTEQIQQLPVGSIDPSPYQPRGRFDDDRLAELAASIREHGVLQPVVVRPSGKRFQVIAGERRLRAARLAGLQTIPGIVRPFSDGQALEAALIENLQREDLSVVEEARAYQRLGEEFGYNQAEIARRTGKSRTAVVNTLRLLQLPNRVLDLLDSGDLSEGHARALLVLPHAGEQVELAEWIVRNAITVREAEAKVRSLIAAAAVTAPAEKKPANAHVEALADRLRQHFGTKVGVSYRKGRGAVTLEFYDDDDLYRLMELMGVRE